VTCQTGGDRRKVGSRRVRAAGNPHRQKREDPGARRSQQARRRYNGRTEQGALIGRLGADPESRSLNNGGKVVNLRLATSETWKDRDGNRQERTEWHSVVIFNEGLAKVAESYLRKGSLCFIEGQLQTRKWTDQSGNDTLLDRDRVAEVPGRAGAAGRTFCWRCGQLVCKQPPSGFPVLCWRGC
jgi:hypothetical protein